MGRIKVSTEIAATPAQVWEEVRHVDRHVGWMADAESITFHGDQTAGTGTSFDCVTKVGPIRLVDRMTVTEWDEGRTMGVRHEGLVTGSGRFTIGSALDGRTTFTWEERLVFPWWMGGPLGGVVGGRIMRLIWIRNLRTLARIVERERT